MICIVKSKEVKLDTIATISSGLVIKRKQAMNESEVLGHYPMLTLKSFEQNGWLNKNELEEFTSNEIIDEKYLTQKGDVIVRLSSPNTAIAIDENSAGILIPSLFTIIRIHSKEILPEYLSILLNSEYMKKIYLKSLVGSAIQVIKTGTLKDINIELKSFKIQEKVVELNQLIRREKMLLEQLLEEKIKYHNAIINKMIQVER